LDASLSQVVPSSVKAFTFNLYEPWHIDGVNFGIELVGTSEFDEEDPDWACAEEWEPEIRGINIPVSYSGQEWEECLLNIKTLLIKQLKNDSSSIRKLKSKQGIGYGFVDGDLEIIWKP
jgi:hypothetical protein